MRFPSTGFISETARAGHETHLSSTIIVYLSLVNFHLKGLNEEMNNGK